jgi:hypothetical protein
MVFIECIQPHAYRLLNKMDLSDNLETQRHAHVYGIHRMNPSSYNYVSTLTAADRRHRFRFVCLYSEDWAHSTNTVFKRNEPQR